jgi:F-type H+-transporting ATPase subunit delta
MAQLNIRYATALFNLAVERDALKETLDEAVFVRNLLSDEECKRLLIHPGISATEKKHFFDTAFQGKISTDMLGFLHLTVEKNRMEFIVPALSSFIEMARQHMRQTTARVVSAVQLYPEQLSALETLLSRKLEKQVEINLQVDPNVIGGLYIEVDGYFVDRTVKTRLMEMKKAMDGGAAII